MQSNYHDSIHKVLSKKWSQKNSLTKISLAKIFQTKNP